MGKHAAGNSNDYIANAFILIGYVVWSYVFERWKAARWLHQTGFAMLAGMAVGLMFQIAEHQSEVMSTEVIIYALLPCIMLDAGYNLHVKEIYKYAGYVLSLGFLGSIVMFVMLYGIFQHMPFIGIKGMYSVTPRHRLIMAMVLTASDTVAPLALLQRAQHKRLHSIVFGEAIMNDVVALFLSTAVVKLDLEHTEPHLLNLAWTSSLDILASTVMGVVCGVSMGWVLGWFRLVIKEGPVERPAAVILLFCYITYGCAEKLGLSGVMVMLITAMVLKFATHEILHSQVDEFLTGITRTAGYLGESFMYGYFGMSFVELVMSSTFEPPSLYFILFSSLSIICCRIPIVFVVRGLAAASEKYLQGDRENALFVSQTCCRCSSISLADTIVVGFCGTIRGVLAVVLIIRVLPKGSDRSAADVFCLQAVLTLVVIHVLVAGPLITVLKKVLRIRTDEELEDLGMGATLSAPRTSGIAHVAMKLAHEGVARVKSSSYQGGQVGSRDADSTDGSPRARSPTIEIELGTIISRVSGSLSPPSPPLPEVVAHREDSPHRGKTKPSSLSSLFEVSL